MTWQAPEDRGGSQGRSCKAGMSQPIPDALKHPTPTGWTAVPSSSEPSNNTLIRATFTVMSKPHGSCKQNILDWTKYHCTEYGFTLCYHMISFIIILPPRVSPKQMGHK